MWILLQQPVKSRQSLRSQPVTWKNKSISGEETFPLSSQVLELETDLIPSNKATCGVRLAVGNDQFITIGYDAAGEKLFIDRSKSGNTNFHNEFASWLYKATRVPAWK